MATIPRVQQASESLVVSRAQGISPSQAAAPFEALTRSGLEMNQLAEQSLQRDGETKAMQDFSNYQIELTQKQQELQQEYASNPEGYVQAYDDASTKLFNEIKGDTDNKYYSQVMEQRLQLAKPSMFKSAIQFEANQKSIVQKQRLTDSIDNLSLLVRQDPNQLKIAQAQVEGNIASASENALIENAEGVRQAAISQLHAAAVDSYINAGDTKSARELLAMDGFQDNLGYEATVKAENNILNTEQKQAKELEKFQERQNLVNTAGIILDAGLPVDPKNKNVEKALNAYYEDSKINERLAAGQTEAAQELETIVEKTSFLPELATSTLRGLLTNGSIEQRTFAADTMSRIEEVNPIALDGVPERDKARALMTTEYLRAGMPPKKVFETVDFQMDTKNKDLIAVRKAELNKAAKDINYASLAEEAMELPFGQFIMELGDPNIPSDVTASAKMQLDYQRLFDSAYMETGDKSVAKKLASKNFRRNYGVYKGEIMKYAPANYYITGSNGDWIEEQIESDVKGMFPDAKNVRIIADSQTAREASTIKEPTYVIMQEGVNGELIEMRDEDGDILRFKPNPDEVIKDLEAKRKKRLGVAESMIEGRSIETEEDLVIKRMGIGR